MGLFDLSIVIVSSKCGTTSNDLKSRVMGLKLNQALHQSSWSKPLGSGNPQSRVDGLDFHCFSNDVDFFKQSPEIPQVIDKLAASTNSSMEGVLFCNIAECKSRALQRFYVPTVVANSDFHLKPFRHWMFEMNFHRALTKAAISIRRLLFQLASPIALAMNPNQGGREVDSDHLIFSGLKMS